MIYYKFLINFNLFKFNAADCDFNEEDLKNLENGMLLSKAYNNDLSQSLYKLDLEKKQLTAIGDRLCNINTHCKIYSKLKFV